MTTSHQMTCAPSTPLGWHKMITIEQISDIHHFEHLRDNWTAIFNALKTTTVFMSYEWCYYWWKHYGHNRKLLILLFKKGGSIIGIAPLMIERCYFNFNPVTSLKFIGEGLSDRTEFLFLEDVEQCFLSLMRYLENTVTQWQLVQLSELNLNLALAHLMNGQGSKSVLLSSARGTMCPYMDLGDNFSAFTKSLKKSLLKSIRNRQRKLSHAGTIDFVRIKNDSSIGDYLLQAAALEKKSWKGKEGKGIFGADTDIAFHTELALAIQERGWLDLFFLRINDQPVCYQYGFTLHDSYLAYNSAYDPAFSYYSPGNQLRLKHIELFIAEGIRKYDHLRGSELYKFAWPVHPQFNHNLIIYKNNLYSRYLLFLEKTTKPLLKKLLGKTINHHGEQSFS